MSILKSLKLSAVTPVRASASEFAFRDKLLRYLDEQKALAEAEIGGTAFQATKRVYAASPVKGLGSEDRVSHMVSLPWSQALHEAECEST